MHGLLIQNKKGDLFSIINNVSDNMICGCYNILLNPKICPLCPKLFCRDCHKGENKCLCCFIQLLGDEMLMMDIDKHGRDEEGEGCHLKEEKNLLELHKLQCSPYEQLKKIDHIMQQMMNKKIDRICEIMLINMDAMMDYVDKKLELRNHQDTSKDGKLKKESIMHKQKISNILDYKNKHEVIEVKKEDHSLFGSNFIDICSINEEDGKIKEEDSYSCEYFIGDGHFFPLQGAYSKGIRRKEELDPYHLTSFDLDVESSLHYVGNSSNNDISTKLSPYLEIIEPKFNFHKDDKDDGNHPPIHLFNPEENFILQHCEFSYLNFLAFQKKIIAVNGEILPQSKADNASKKQESSLEDKQDLDEEKERKELEKDPPSFLDHMSVLDGFSYVHLGLFDLSSCDEDFVETDDCYNDQQLISSISFK